jgi:hypothetical protein
MALERRLAQGSGGFTRNAQRETRNAKRETRNAKRESHGPLRLAGCKYQGRPAGQPQPLLRVKVLELCIGSGEEDTLDAGCPPVDAVQDALQDMP